MCDICKKESQKFAFVGKDTYFCTSFFLFFTIHFLLFTFPFTLFLLPFSFNMRTWSWILTSNFSEGLPYAIINTMLVAILFDLGLPGEQITMLTGAISLPWAFKALWSPLVDLVGTKRRWMLIMQLCLSALLLVAALSLSHFDASSGSSAALYVLIGAFFVSAFFSATYDMACDGFYMIALPEDRQAFFVGIRSTAYRLGWLLAGGGFVALTGFITSQLGWSITAAWQCTLVVSAVMLFLLFLLHSWLLPKAERPDLAPVQCTVSHPIHDLMKWVRGIEISWVNVLFMLLFLFTFRLGEALLSKVTMLFLKAPVTEGGMGLDNAEYGLLYGTFGVLALVIGGILGGMAISRWGLRRCILPMALMLNVPDLLYVWLASMTDGTIALSAPSIYLIGTCITIEQFGYGFGFTAYMVFMLQQAQGEYATARYACLTALMAIGMSIPTMISGSLLADSSYLHFFWIACVCTLPSFLMAGWYILRTQSITSSRTKE